MKSLIRRWDEFATSSERDAKVAELYDYTREFLKNPLCVAAIRALAEALFEQKKLPGEQARTLISRAITKRIRCPHCVGDADRYRALYS